MANQIWHKLAIPSQPVKPPVYPPALLQRQPAHNGIRFAPVPNVSAAAKSSSGAQTKLASPLGVKFAPIPNMQRGLAAVPHPPLMAVQRYKVVSAASQTPTNYGLNYDLRVSHDGKMAVKDTGNVTPRGTNQFQDLYLTPEVFNVSNQALTNANSGITLTQTATTIRGKPPGNHIKRTLHLITIQFADTPNNESYEGCNANAWNVMGTVRNAQPSGAVATHGYFKSKISGSRWVASQNDDGGALKGVRNKITGLTQAQSRQAWQQLSDRERRSAVKKYGINKFAKPKAGEGIGIFQTGTDGRDGMGHWAGVLARSGGDYVTIENYAGNPGGSLHGHTAVNTNWYIRMFGSKTGQSFYEFHKTYEATDYGTQPIAIRYQAR